MFSNSLCRVISIAKISGGLLALYKTLKISCSSRQQVCQKSWTGSLQGKVSSGDTKMPPEFCSTRRLVPDPSPAGPAGVGGILGGTGGVQMFLGCCCSPEILGDAQKWSEAPPWIHWINREWNLGFGFGASPLGFPAQRPCELCRD